MSRTTFSPMLAVQYEPASLTFPKWASVKLDGIRCVIKDGELLARSLKPIRNAHLRSHFADLIDLSKRGGVILDGEIYCHGPEFGQIASIVNSEDKPVPEQIKFCAFDLLYPDLMAVEFSDRWRIMKTLVRSCRNAVVVDQKPVENMQEVQDLFGEVLKDGYEGLILRDPSSPYKFGRSTVKEGWMLKVKPFETFDTIILDVIERFENTNESDINELGYKFKHQNKDAKAATGIASAFLTELNGIQGKVVLTGEEAFRREIWLNKEAYIGRTFEWKGMLVGAKDFPRHPNFIRMRDDK